MVPAGSVAALQRWSSVLRWTIFGTLGCVLVSVGFNIVLFDDLGPDAMGRGILAGTALPVMLGVPLFFYMSMRVRGLAISNQRLGLVARTDSLTSCLNRGAFTGKVCNLLDHNQDAMWQGALLMIDADNFKSINDLFGHDAGDEALTIIARSIRSILRAGDLVGRMGGEEFGVFLPGVDLRGAEAVAERIRRTISLAIFAPDGRLRQLSVSIGGAAFTGQADFRELFRIADQRLYSAKQAGRNRSIIVLANDYPDIVFRRTA